MLDVVYPVTRGDTVPADHLYPLYAALSGLVPAFHDEAVPLRFAPLSGVLVGPRLLGIGPNSHLRIRLPEDAIRLVLPLAGKALDVAGHRIRLGVPSVMTLTSVASLHSRIVTFSTKARGEITPDLFLDTARKKLAEMNIEADVSIPLALTGEFAGQPKRKIVRIHEAAIVGYSLLVTGLTAEQSLQLQQLGLGGRGKIGCGFFLPAREGK